MNIVRLYLFLVEMGSPKNWRNGVCRLGRGQLEEARIQLQVWQILELLDHLVEILGDEPLDLQEFTQL